MMKEFADGCQFSSKQKGSVFLKLYDEKGDEASPIILRSVYYVPELEMFVVSFSQLTIAGISSTITRDIVQFIDAENNDMKLGCGFLTKESLLYNVSVAMPKEKGSIYICKKSNEKQVQGAFSIRDSVALDKNHYQ